MGSDAVSELMRIVHAGQTNAPRTLQKTPGPSELGRPCPRRLAYKVLEQPPRDGFAGGGSWYATVGTGMHAWLTDAYRKYGGHLEASTVDRYRLDWRVEVGEGVSGTLDVYDRQTATVIDWKVVGETTLKEVRRGKISAAYRTQVHLYGMGVENAGQPIERVSILFVPRNAQDVSDAVLWSEPWERGVADAALTRLKAVRTAVDQWGFDAPLKIRAEFDRCGECPWYDPGKSNGFLCPGVNVGASDPMAGMPLAEYQ